LGGAAVIIECPVCGEGWTPEQRSGLERGPGYAVLRDMVELWISEGWTVPPYSSEQYEIFAWLGITGEVGGYDTTPPTQAGAEESPL
jgi:hypothetical protein